MALSIRPSDGNRLTRPEKIELDADVLAAAEESLSSGKAQEAVYATEKEAKATLSKLRTHLNEQGRGLRAKVAADGDEWVLEFKVSATKRVMNPTS